MFKKHIIIHILYIIAAPLLPVWLKRSDFYKAPPLLKSSECSDWPADLVRVIGQAPQVCVGNVTTLNVNVSLIFFFMFLKVSSAQQGCIYLIKINTIKTVKYYSKVK